jgi:hypothetical protein
MNDIIKSIYYKQLEYIKSIENQEQINNKEIFDNTTLLVDYIYGCK